MPVVMRCSTSAWTCGQQGAPFHSPPTLGSRTTPPAPTCFRPASNCGLMSATSRPSGRSTLVTPPMTSSKLMKDRSRASSLRPMRNPWLVLHSRWREVMRSRQSRGRAVVPATAAAVAWGGRVYSQLEGDSHVVNTAWAMLTLMSAGHHTVDPAPLHAGARFLLRRQQPSGDWPQQHISGVFNRNCMITYANYSLTPARHTYLGCSASITTCGALASSTTTGVPAFVTTLSPTRT
ncbi:Cycloartenol synthase [Tetrabaena socialis]|uniref:Cycloartenol synthase n=1 Tax=Tetrabaena socialis TaxID=47790 RepID=A0A2J8AJL4_9CHLO|nr:Cycloartenol synthase [Tetrabaena socialis]|eukprot:PNH12704.1 Cycloartenol synthase [Tetrabaena socialis]